MLNRDKLQKTLQGLDSVDIIDLASLMDMGVDELLTCIKDEILLEFKAICQIIDLGMLCQHVIKDIGEPMKHNFGHQALYNAWLRYRGY